MTRFSDKFWLFEHRIRFILLFTDPSSSSSCSSRVPSPPLTEMEPRHVARRRSPSLAWFFPWWEKGLFLQYERWKLVAFKQPSTERFVKSDKISRLDGVGRYFTQLNQAIMMNVMLLNWEQKVESKMASILFLSLMVTVSNLREKCS